MSDETSSTAPEKSLFEKIGRAFSATPRSSDDITDMLRSAQSESIIDASVLQIMEGALKVSDLQAREIMIPRSQMVMIEDDFTLEEVLNVVIESQHSRFPVVGESSDDIKGILLAKEMLPLLLADTAEFNLESLLRPATIIPESKRLNVLLQEFREKRYHMAIVVDEYGGVSGLVTIEDILEEIVGEIEDETDDHEEASILPTESGAFTVEAITEISDFNEFFDVGLADDEFDTVGGLVLHALGRLPELGETITIDNFHFKVTGGDNRKITQLEVTKVNP
ncbi:MAG: CBS domain-containing protein [Porticoccaceae bacterium]|jgi:magnesium and cobalt transporter|nr:MAG: magnesium transporter [SAR92 bacterium BACL16 MAG-120619-bin48]KRP27037.1 MAG: magnesium transporter [SAR92 bacterium BACL16 MAG-120322-bin99]MDO7636764.1 CBS domain-containing protein [Porticoccaceae bacterium]MDP4654233.1 CBS domain-containing protein [Alphaproteobacteria bacterium]MDP4744166.1 CBS domain-containing protein [Porticoccaceae bacterium]|tara:strand:- start:3148 stop:3987 length:840 start_codon:yes stop_codon:yes gene_type:complete